MFLDFVEVERITGQVLADTILQRLTAWNLSLTYIQGQCYNGSSNMSGGGGGWGGERSGCRTIVQQQAPMVIYTHCAVHQLNLAVVSSCKILSFKNVESYW